MRAIFVIFLLEVLSFGSIYSQDVWLQNHFSPSSGCSLSNNEAVNVLVNNNSGVVMASNTINLKYTIDNGSPTQQFLSSNLLPGASWNFVFNVNANLSSCGPHTVKVWVTRAGDLNHLNDTLQWVVQNDCPISPGAVNTSATVCDGSNSGTLNLMGWSNGTITDWQYSTNNGTSWTGTGTTGTSFNYSNLTQETTYQVIIDGGFCADAVSQPATLSIEPVPVRGTISGSGSFCADNASGILTLNGASNPVISWESSTNNGTSWSTIANTSATLNYSNLTQTTLYRAYTDGGICPGTYSDTAEITVTALSNAGVLSSNQNVCSGGSFTMTLAGYTGAITSWESSLDNISWTTIANTTNSHQASNLVNTISFNVIVDNGICPADTSNTVVLSVYTIAQGTLLASSDSFCASNVAGSVVLNGASGVVAYWQSSTDDGANWTTITNTTTTQSFSNLNETTWYRAYTDDGICTTFSDTAIIFIQEVTNPGILIDDDTVCLGQGVTVNLSGYNGTILQWESSTNGTDWNVINHTASGYTATPTEEIAYRVVLKNGICPKDTSNKVTIVVNPLPVVDAGDAVSIELGETVTLNGSGGVTGVWTPGTTLSDSLIANPVAAPQVTTVYNYIVIDANECINSDQVTVTVTLPTDSSLMDIKNVITANNDGFNDAWMIEGLEWYPNTFVAVFNTYGKEVYSSDNYANDWKGTYNNGHLPNGTYYYTVMPGGTDKEYKGTLTILGNE